MAHALVQSRASILIVVDECPRDIAVRLGDVVASEGSSLRLLTIDIDERPIQGASWLGIAVEPSDETLIEAIIRQRLPAPSDPFTIDYIKNLCGGFPRIAVLATANVGIQAPVLKSIDDVVERILVGCGIKSRDQLRAVECLALFDRLWADDEHSGAAGARRIDLLRATTISRVIAEATPDLQRAFSTMALLRQHEECPSNCTHIVDRRGRYFLVQPTPVRAYLAERLLLRAGPFGTVVALETEFGASILNELVHVVPDVAADTLHRTLGSLSLEQLQALSQGRRYIVWALQKLVFRPESFASLSARAAVCGGGPINAGQTG